MSIGFQSMDIFVEIQCFDPYVLKFIISKLEKIYLIFLVTEYDSWKVQKREDPSFIAVKNGKHSAQLMHSALFSWHAHYKILRKN